MADWQVIIRFLDWIRRRLPICEILFVVRFPTPHSRIGRPALDPSAGLWVRPRSYVNIVLEKILHSYAGGWLF